MNEEELKKLQSTVEFDFKKAVTIYGPNIIQEEKLTSCYDRVYDFLGELDIDDFHDDVSCPDIFNENLPSLIYLPIITSLTLVLIFPASLSDK